MVSWNIFGNKDTTITWMDIRESKEFDSLPLWFLCFGRDAVEEEKQ